MRIGLKIFKENTQFFFSPTPKNLISQPPHIEIGELTLVYKRIRIESLSSKDSHEVSRESPTQSKGKTIFKSTELDAFII